MRTIPVSAVLLWLSASLFTGNLIAAPDTATNTNTAAPAAVGNDTAMDTRLKNLEEDLRCLVCQNQSLADSPSEWADGMRAQIRDKIKEGSTDDEIIEFLIARYGDFVTYKPPLKPTTYILWFGPILVMLLALTIVIVYVRRRSREKGPEELDDDQERRARALLDGDKE
jgi:cytochrome c-type biogenesis protein CcmH